MLVSYLQTDAKHMTFSVEIPKNLEARSITPNLRFQAQSNVPVEIEFHTIHRYDTVSRRKAQTPFLRQSTLSGCSQKDSQGSCSDDHLWALPG